MRHQTATIGTGQDFWTKAIDRGRRRRRRRRGSTWLGVGVVAAVVIVAGSLAGRSGEDRPEPVGPTVETPTASPDGKRDDACPVGEERRVLPVSPKSLVLGCAQLPDGRKVALLNGYRSRGLCLQLVGIDNRARECGNAPSALDPPNTQTIAFQGIAQRNELASLEVFGITSADVATVELSYMLDGSSHRARTTVIRVTDVEVLEQARIAEPFVYFLAELPADTASASATARRADGQRLGTDDFQPYPWSKRSRTMITGLVLWNGSRDGG